MNATIETDECPDLLRKPEIGGALHDGQPGIMPKVSPAPAALRELLASGPVDSRAVLAGMEARGFTPKQVRKGREVLGVVIHRTGFGAETGTTWALPSTGVPGGQECRAAGSGGAAAGQPVRPFGSLRACAPRVRARDRAKGVAGSDKVNDPRTHALARAGIGAGTSEGTSGTPPPKGVLTKVNLLDVHAEARQQSPVGWRPAPQTTLAVPTAPAVESPWTTKRIKFFIEVRGVDAVTARRVALRLLDRDRQNSPEASCLECQGYTMRELCRAKGPQPIEPLWVADCLRRD